MLAALVVVGCAFGPPEPHSHPPASAAPSSPSLPHPTAILPAPRLPTAGATSAAPASVPASGAPRTACEAPSLQLKSPADARDAAALGACAFQKSGHDDIADRCATVPHEVPLARLDEAVLAFDEPTREAIRAIAEQGRSLGRNPRAFGLVGDSITASPKFLSPFAQPQELPAAVAAELALGAGTIVDRYRGVDVLTGLDSFVAPRAAKIGAHSGWALPASVTPAISPLGQLVATQSPAIALLMYGSNDAAVRFVAYDDLVAGYRKRMTRILDYLIAAGIVPVLHTIPRHMYDPAMLACDQAAGDVSNWHLAVQTSALSAVAASLACERHLPLIDLRHAFDALLNHGIGPDGVHPNAHPGGAARLDPEGLRCGYNARNYVALKMLRELTPFIDGT